MIRYLARAACLVLVTTPLYATTYTLEPDYTQGVFRWNHLGFSSPAAQFAQAQGTLEFDPANPTHAWVKVTIPLSTLNTGVPALDDDFRSSDFFDTARFPTATFTSTRVEQAGDRLAHGSSDRAASEGIPSGGGLKVTGDLNLHGVTRPVTLDVTLVKIGTNPRSGVPTIGFDATTTLKRSEFGLAEYVPQVGDEIQMHIITQGAEAKAYAEYLRAHPPKK